jgi:hypothetical protein
MCDGNAPVGTNFYASHYRSGEEILPGDRVLYDGRPGVVVFVVGAANNPPEWEPFDWLASPEGFMLDTEVAGLVFQPESDEDLDFVARKL